MIIIIKITKIIKIIRIIKICTLPHETMSCFFLNPALTIHILYGNLALPEKFNTSRHLRCGRVDYLVFVELQIQNCLPPTQKAPFSQKMSISPADFIFCPSNTDLIYITITPGEQTERVDKQQNIEPQIFSRFRNYSHR